MDERHGGGLAYCHVATGNYNVRTGGVHGDLGLFTSRESLGEDLTAERVEGDVLRR